MPEGADIKARIGEIPVRVRWLGWQSDTYTLRRQGWQVFADERISDFAFEHQMRLVLKDPEGKMIIMGQVALRPEQIFASRYNGETSQHRIAEMLYHRGIEMTGYRATDQCRIYEVGKVDWASMDAALPCDGFAWAPEEIHDIRDLKLFRYTESPKEIYIPLGSVDDCLNRILQLQYPEQQIIKASEAGRIVKPVAQAKIYSLAA